MDERGLWQFNLHPGLPPIGNPAMAVAVAAIVHPFQGVNLVTGQRAGSGGARAIRRQGQIMRLIRAVNLKFINPRLADIGRPDSETNEPGGNGCELLDIAPRMNRLPQIGARSARGNEQAQHAPKKCAASRHSAVSVRIISRGQGLGNHSIGSQRRGGHAHRCRCETAPLPTWVGWYAHQMPVWAHRASGALVYLVELGLRDGAEVHLLADEPGPIRLYERLGFVEVGLVVGALLPRR